MTSKMWRVSLNCPHLKVIIIPWGSETANSSLSAKSRYRSTLLAMIKNHYLSENLSQLSESGVQHRNPLQHLCLMLMNMHPKNVLVYVKRFYSPDHQMMQQVMSQSLWFWGLTNSCYPKNKKTIAYCNGKSAKISFSYPGVTCPKQVDQHEASHSASPCEPKAYCKTEACSYKTSGHQCGGSLGGCLPPLCPAAAGIVLGESQKGIHIDQQCGCYSFKTIFHRAERSTISWIPPFLGLASQNCTLDLQPSFCHTTGLDSAVPQCRSNPGLASTISSRIGRILRLRTCI